MKTLFSKLLAFALICAVACNVVGCKNYDDEIGAVNDRIDQLEGTVALKTDLQALQATVTAIENSYVSKTELAEALKAYAKPADIAAAVANAEKAMNEALGEIEDAILALQTASSKHQTAEQVAATVENMLNSYKIWADTEAYIEAQISAIVTGLTEAEVKALLAEYVKTADLHEAILGWTGDELQDFLTAEALEAYVTDEALVEALEEYLTAEDIADFITADAVKELIAEADNSEALKAAILEAMTGEEGAVTVAVSELNAAIEALAKRVEALEGMIQSIVWVPTVYEQVSSGIVMFAGASYVEMEKTVEGTTETEKFYVKPSTKTLKFKVTPAAAAKDIKKENVTIDMQEVTRTDAELFSVVSVEGDDKGILTVEVACNDFVAATEMENMPIISLNVNYGKANCASNYIGVIVAGESAADVKYGTKNAETNVITGIGTPNSEGINIIEGQYVYYNDEPVASMPAATAYINGEELPEGWSVEVEVGTAASSGNISSELFINEAAENGGYILGPNNAKEIIGKGLTGVYHVYIKNGEYSYFVGQYNKTLTVHKYPAPGSIKSIETPYALEAIFNGENYSFFDEDVTYSKVKAALWEANKEIFEPYGYNADSFLNTAASNPVLKAESLSISSDNTYGLELVLDTDGDTFGVKCPDTAEGKAWAGKDAQNFTLKYKSEANCSVNESGVCEPVEEAIEITFTAKLTMPTVTLDPNEYYVVDGIATAYAEWRNVQDDEEYVVVDKDLGPAYEWICDTADDDEIVLVYSIAEDLTNFQGTPPAIDPTTNKLSWNDWAGLSIDVKVAASYATNPTTELASEVFSVEIASPVGALTAENKTVASANPSDVTFAELFKAVMAGTNANTSIDVLESPEYFEAIGGAIEYTVEIPEDATMIVTKTTDGIKFVNPALHLTKDIEIKVTAKFTNRFTEEQTATATVTLTK